MLFRSLAFASLILASSISFGSPLRVDGQIFRDADGKHVLLRGVNVSGASKIPPFRAIRGPEDLAPLRRWGFNSIRLLFNWEAYEPERYSYDESYMEYYIDVIRWAAQSGLYVIVDIHQDAFSRFTGGGCGDGFPEWAIAPGIPRDEPKNDERCRSWGITTVLDPNMHKAWDEFYKNSDGARDRYLAMAKNLSRAVAEESNVLGVALLNEPWGDEKTQLYGLYYDASLIIRNEFPDSILFLSGAAKTSTGVIPSELPKIPGENIVHETHFYDPGIGLGKWSKWLLELSNLAWKGIIKNWKTPIYIGEFGAPETLQDAAGYIENIYDILDREAYSGAYWVYTPTFNELTKDGWNLENFSLNGEDGELRGMYRPRPWLEAISSQLMKMEWDAQRLVLDIDYDARTDGWLEIVVPEGYKFQKARAGLDSLKCNRSSEYRIGCKFSKAFFLGQGRARVHFAKD